MKRTKRLQLLSAVLVVAAAACFGITQYQEEQEHIKNTGEVVFTLDSDSVTALSWSYDDTTLSFHKDEAWVYDEDEAFPVDGEQIDVLLSYFTEMNAAFTIEDVENLGDYGLDAPACTIEITTDTGTETITLGDYSNMDEQRYVSTGDGNVYLVATDPLGAYEVELSDLIDNDDIPGFGSVESIQIEGADTYDIVYKEYEETSTDTYNSEDVYFKEEDDALQPLDTDKVDSYLSTLSGLNQDTYVTYNATEEDLASYGLDDPELSMSIAYTTTETNEDGETTEEAREFSFSLSRDAATKAAAQEEDEETSGQETTDEESVDEEKVMAYVRIGDSPIIYEVSETTYDALMACTYNDLRHDAVYSGEFSQITAFEVTLDGKTYDITSAEEDDARTFSYEDETIDTSALEQALEALTVTSFEEVSTEGEEELALTISLDNEAFPTLSLSFNRYDGENCQLTMDGEVVGLVARSEVVDLIEAFNEIVL